MADILIVEDSLEVCHLVRSILKGLCVIHSVTTVQEAKIFFMHKSVDLVIIDINLPDGSGFDLVSYIKEQGRTKQVPFLMLSGDSTTESQIAGFSMGAEDYITKPFNPHILRARIQNLLKRPHLPDEKGYSVGDLYISVTGLRAYRKLFNAELSPVDLTTLEFRLLNVFAENIGNSLGRQTLKDLVWGYATNVVDRVVDQHVSILRKKLYSTNLQIRSLYGFGYRMEIIETASENSVAKKEELALPRNIQQRD